MNINSAIINGAKVLKDNSISNPFLDSEILMAKAIDKDRKYVLLNSKRPIDIDRIEQMVTGIVRRLESLGETDIPSDKVGEIVMETLARIDTVAYVRFASVYKNFQAADDFEEFVSELRPDIK